jgi:hypothetical protein
MISPNAGKVLLGADGNPLLGAAGKIVLADSLYPMVPTQTLVKYKREVYVDGLPPPCAAEDVWTSSWITNSSWAFGHCWYDMSKYGTLVRQAIIQTSLSEGAIDWSRVKKLTQTIRYYHLNYTAGYAARITSSKNNSTLPEDTSIRDSWELCATIPANTQITSPGLTLELQWIIDGVRPDSVEFSISYDTDVCASSTIATNIFVGVIQPVRVVYNLAEPTP